jgi:nucleoid-associated protein YgaU
MYLSVGVLMVVAAAPTQCQQRPTNVPQGSVVYRTRAGDTPYRLADRLYGKGYLQDRIVQANRGRLPPNGVFEPGTYIVIPPNLNGESVDLSRFLEKPY